MIQIDMPMPKDCLDCPACNEYLMCAIPASGRGWGENDVREFGQSRPEWCPMVEVPTPHGRLIDGSELVVKYDLYAPIAPVVEGDSEHWTNLIHTRHILNAPTVIKAEDE